MTHLDLKASKLRRKQQLAELVATRLQSLGHQAQILTNHLNPSGHRDLVVVTSSLGLVHTTASKSTDPNSSILVSDIEDGSQLFLEGKAWIAFGWVDRCGRTLLQFVLAEHVRGRLSIPKTEVLRRADRDLSSVIPPVGAT